MSTLKDLVLVSIAIVTGGLYIHKKLFHIATTGSHIKSYMSSQDKILRRRRDHMAVHADSRMKAGVLP